MNCKDCEPDVLLPTCRSDADCHNGGTCRPIWPAPSAPSTHRNVCFGHSDALLVPVHGLVACARHSVGIAALQPIPDSRFLAALRGGLAVLATGRPITVRLLVRQYPPDGADAAALLSSFTSGRRRTPGARLTLSVAAMRSCTSSEACRSFSWPHAKFMDGNEVLVGGHNFWSEDYLVDKPVHDLSLRVGGPAGASASRFADRLWRFVCANPDGKPAVQLASFASAGSVVPSLVRHS